MKTGECIYNVSMNFNEVVLVNVYSIFLNEKQYLQSCKWSGVKIMHKVFKSLPQNVFKIEQHVRVICTEGSEIKYNIYKSFQKTCTQRKLYDWWELKDHRFQSKLIIIVFTRFHLLVAEAMDNILHNLFPIHKVHKCDITKILKINHCYTA